MESKEGDYMKSVVNGVKRRYFGDKQRTGTFMTTARDFPLLFLVRPSVLGKLQENY